MLACITSGGEFMSLHIVHFIGPINHNAACTVRKLCLQALQSGASEIALHRSTEGGNMTAGFAAWLRPIMPA
jgi:ATP-dependent Clp protease protease subunit